MAETIDEITIEYTDGGVLVTKVLDQEVLTRGAWTTIIFRYQSWNETKQAYGPEAYSIRRYQKKGGAYMQRSKFNISNADQAKKLIEILTRWVA